MPDFNRDGRPDSPYYDNQLNSVIVEVGGDLAIRTTGGGGGGGDATAANQVLEIAQLNNLNSTATTIRNNTTYTDGRIRVVTADIPFGSNFTGVNVVILGIISKTTGFTIPFVSAFTSTSGLDEISICNVDYIQTDITGAVDYKYDASKCHTDTATIMLAPNNSITLSGCLDPFGVYVIYADKTLN